MNNIYKLTIKDRPGALYFSYKKGALLEVLLSFTTTLENWSEVRQYLPYDERYVRGQQIPAHYKIDELRPRTVADKLAAFCMLYRAHRNSAYTAKKNERANIADVTMSNKLLEVYFTNTDYPLTYAKSISDYVKHYNLIRDLATNGTPVKNKFPDVYDREYERTLEPEKLSEYRKHLIAIGYRHIDGTWTKPNI